MLFDDILTDTSDLLSQRLLAAGYIFELDFYPKMKMVIANTIKFGDLSVSYSEESGHQNFITCMESLTETDNDCFAGPFKKGRSHVVKALSVFADYLVNEVPGHAWLRAKNQAQQVAKERLVDYAIQHFGLAVTSLVDSGGVWIECDLQALLQRKQAVTAQKLGVRDKII